MSDHAIPVELRRHRVAGTTAVARGESDAPARVVRSHDRHRADGSVGDHHGGPAADGHRVGSGGDASAADHETGEHEGRRSDVTRSHDAYFFGAGGACSSVTNC